MKKYRLFWIVCGLLVLAGCTDNTDNPARKIELKNFSNTGCKSYTRAGSTNDTDGSYFELTAIGDNMLYVKHVNAMFNCASDKFEVNVDADGNSIIITEYDKLNPEYAMACMCAFDLGYEIGPLDDGKTYTIKVVTGSAPQDPDMIPANEEVIFEIVYTSDLSKTIVPSQDTIDPALLEQTTPEFTYSDFDVIENQYEVTTSVNGTWTIKKVNGMITSIDYGQQPSPAAHQSPEAFFDEYLPLTNDDEMVRDTEWNNPPVISYRHFYKGLHVEKSNWGFYYNDNRIYRVVGFFYPTNHLDVIPAISEENAKKIVENYIKESVEGKDKCFYLAIMSFPAVTTLLPRLVYVYKHDLWGEHNYVYVDAKTGRLLYHLQYHGDKLYY